MRVLVTGANGFIGSHVVRRLVAEGAEVIALTRPKADLRRLVEIGPQINLVEADLLKPETVEPLLRAQLPEVCLHLAWYIAPGTHPNSLQNIEYVSASMCLLQLLDEVGCKRTVITGTCLEQDARFGYLAEDTPAAPQNFYAACKHALHIMAGAFQKRQQRGFAWARLFNSYGPWEYDGPLVSDIIQKLLCDQACDLTSGEQFRDYLHVDDIASALCALLRTEVDGDFNIGSGRPVAVADIARLIGKLLDRTHLLHFGVRALSSFDSPFCCANSQRLRTHTGWQPSRSLDAGLCETIDWWRTYGPRMSPD